MRAALALAACSVLAAACTPTEPAADIARSAQPSEGVGSADAAIGASIPAPSDSTTTTVVVTTTTEPVPAGSERTRDEGAGGMPAATQPATTVRRTTSTTAAYVAPAPAQGGSGACGGSLPPCWVMRAESGGNIRAVNASSGAAGKWQFLPSTSRAMGYARPMNEYDEATQDEAARTLWAGGSGCSHWAAC